MPTKQRNTSEAILNTIRWITGSQWRERRRRWIHNDERYKLVELQNSVLAEVWRCARKIDRRVRHCHSLVATAQRPGPAERQLIVKGTS
jgi:hypothetical protein